MKLWNKYVRILTLASLVIASVNVNAQTIQNQDTVNTSTKSEANINPEPSPWGFNMKLNADGPTFSNTDGLEGKGSNLNLRNSFRLSYKLENNWSLELTPILEYRSENPKRAESFHFSDPYLAVKKDDIFNSRIDGYNLYSEVRYYVPVSKETTYGIGTVKDRGNGMAMGRLIYSQTILDGYVANVTEYDYRKLFAEKPVAKKGIDSTHEFYNWIQYKNIKGFTPYISYKNIVNRYIVGGDPWAKNHTVGVGGKWQATKELSVEPYIDSPFLLKDSIVKLEAVYTFI